jgi:hypothetical protein
VESLTLTPYVAPDNPVWYIGNTSVVIATPKGGSTHSMVYGDVPPSNDIDTAPTLVFEQSPVTLKK